MDIRALLEYVRQSPTLPGISVIHVPCVQYSPLGASLLLTSLKGLLEVPVVVVDPEAYTLDQVKLQASVSFLGHRTLYWIKSLASLNASSRVLWVQYLARYQGPHCMLFFEVAPIALEHAYYITVHIPDAIDQHAYKELFSCFYSSQGWDPRFSAKLFERTKSLSLDRAALCMAYQVTVGRSRALFFDTWFDEFLVPEQSLFTLSSYLFARQPKEFFTYWLSYRHTYPDEFWIAFWSDQLWQAALFLDTVASEGLAQAKQSAQKLPFSFINKDWRHFTFFDIAQAHHALYQLDYRLKNSMAYTYDLDLWYSIFFFLRSKQPMLR